MVKTGQRLSTQAAIAQKLGSVYPLGMEYLDILIYAALTVFLATRLWSVLGQRDDDDARPPRKDPFAPRGKEPDGDEEDVMVLEGRARAVLSPEPQAPMHAPASLAGALDQLRALDPSFDEKKFIEGAKIAFSQIVSAYAAGDLTPVAWLLGPVVRDSFEQAVAARQQSGQMLENKIDRFAAADIVAAKIDGTKAVLTVEFVSHQINLLRDQAGRLVDGKEGQAVEVRDLWVFERNTQDLNPNWRLVETRS